MENPAAEMPVHERVNFITESWILCRKSPKLSLSLPEKLFALACHSYALLKDRSERIAAK